ncbi:MAG: peptidoglycan editing factor PgeF [Lachnospiraceae bacterium]|nr:peptidoglycan editing factor PgeF [Lachnospiraceae bacterium]
MSVSERILVRKAGSMQQMKINQYKQTEYLTFPLLEETGLVRHLFSTRIGGVSTGIYSSMNLSYSRGDLKEAVDENFRRMAEIFQAGPERFVCSKQTHTTNVRRVTEEDCGKGVVRPTDYDDVDGLITNVPGVILSTSYADCVPLYFVDKENKAIGLSHSGWRGTVARMGKATLKAMAQEFGTRPEQVVAAVGPSICVDCYEVSEDVAMEFRKNFPDSYTEFLRSGKMEEKYQLDLWQANRRVLLDAGILPENIAVTDLCTCCNSGYLYSHRASNGQRGALAAMMELRKS